MDLLSLAKNLNVPALSAFMLGIMASIGPCTMATNIAALAYVSRRITDRKFAVTGAALYTLGRMITYTVLGMLIIYTGLSIPAVSNFLQEFGEVAVGPFLIVVGLIMLFLDRISFGDSGHGLADQAKKFADMGLLGALPLGAILALAFCPYSAVLFFMVLIPLALKSPAGPAFPSLFALGTGLPVLVFGLLLSLGVAGAARWLNAIGNAEKYIRIAIAVLFILVGIYCMLVWLGVFS